MTVERRLRRLLIATLAVPVVATVYVAALVGGVGAVLRRPLAAVLGATVIGSVYAGEAWRHAPAPVRVAPLRATAVMALAAVFLATSLPAAPVRAADPLTQVLRTARDYIGTPYKLGAERRDLVDCSGLIYRVFADLGELPRIGGKRLRALGYYRWFNSRGLASKKNPQKGDLVVYVRPNHIGIYMGDGKVLSALVSGVKIHDLHGISADFVAFLHVDYAVGDPKGAPGNGNGNGNNGNDGTTRPDRGQTDGRPKAPDAGQPDGAGEPAGRPREGGEPDPDVARGFATGTMNMRLSADPQARIVGWVRRGSTFEIVGEGNSPSGALWYEVRTQTGKTGWVYSRWARLLDR